MRNTHVAALLAVLCVGCGKAPTGLINGSFRLGSVTCDSNVPVASINSIYKAPNSLGLVIAEDTATHTQVKGGCTITWRSSVSYEKPGQTTASKMLETTGGTYDCSPAACDSTCGAPVTARTIDYDFVFASGLLNLFSVNTDPLCTDAGDRSPVFYVYTQQ